MGKKYFLGQLNIYLWMEKSHAQLSIKLDFKPNLGMGFFFGTEKVCVWVHESIRKNVKDLFHNLNKDIFTFSYYYYFSTIRLNRGEEK